MTQFELAQLMKERLDEVSYKRWSRLYAKTELLNTARKVHSLEGIKLARESDRIYREWENFWKNK